MAHDLDGTRLRIEGDHRVWLMINGERRLIADTSVYDALFSDVIKLRTEEDVESLPEGPPLNEGTCLVRPYGELSIYLVTGYPMPQRHLIETYETLIDFAFTESKVWNVPPLVLDSVPLGPPIMSGPERARMFNC